MLTRTSDGATTTFLWNGRGCIPDLTPEGQLAGSPRHGKQYCDALGCLRLVTDSSDPGVGADADTGLIYTQQRWYDPATQRFRLGPTLSPKSRSPAASQRSAAPKPLWEYLTELSRPARYPQSHA